MHSWRNFNKNLTQSDGTSNDLKIWTNQNMYFQIALPVIGRQMVRQSMEKWSPTRLPVSPFKLRFAGWRWGFMLTIYDKDNLEYCDV